MLERWTSQRMMNEERLLSFGRAGGEPQRGTWEWFFSPTTFLCLSAQRRATVCDIVWIIVSLGTKGGHEALLPLPFSKVTEAALRSTSLPIHPHQTRTIRMSKEWEKIKRVNNIFVGFIRVLQFPPPDITVGRWCYIVPLMDKKSCWCLWTPCTHCPLVATAGTAHI